jgi:hypothetical protein
VEARFSFKVEARFSFKVEFAFRLRVQARSIAFLTWETKLYPKYVVSNVHHVLKVFIVLFLIVSAHFVVIIVHHITFPFYGKYYPYPYIVLQIEISLEVKNQWLQSFNENIFHFKYVHLA